MAKTNPAIVLGLQAMKILAWVRLCALTAVLSVQAQPAADTLF